MLSRCLYTSQIKYVYGCWDLTEYKSEKGQLLGYYPWYTLYVELDESFLF